jgi:oxysterol-binding protein 1
LKSPRVKLLDLSYMDDVTGTTLLHEAAKRKDLRLVELAVQAGADVFVRDRRGKTVSEGAGKDDRVKVFLRQCKCSNLVAMGHKITHVSFESH